MEVKNLSDQDKRNYLAQNGWDVYEVVSDIKNARYVPKSLFNSPFTPLSLEDACAFCMRLEAAAKERFKESEYKPESILDEEVKKERPNDLSIDAVEFERLKKYEEYRRGEDRKIMEQSVSSKENVKKCQTQMVQIPLDHYSHFLRIEREYRERDLVKEVLEPEHYEEKYTKMGVRMETKVMQKMTETDRVIERLERLVGMISNNTAHLGEITRKLCFDNTEQPTADNVAVNKNEPRTSIEKLDLLLDEGNRVADHLAYLVEFQSNVI